MFILYLNVESATKLVKALLSSANGTDDQKTEKTTRKPSKPDGYVSKGGNPTELKSDRNLLLFLLGFVLQNKSERQQQFNDYLATLEKNLPKKSEFSDAQGKKTQDYLSGTLAEYAHLFGEKEGEDESDARARGNAALGSVSAAHPRTALARLIKISKNADFPADIRAFAMALVSDALSHMKQQDVDSKSAQTLVKLLNNTPPQVREVLFAALRDAKKIKEESEKKEKGEHVVYDYTSQRDRRVNQNLTLA